MDVLAARDPNSWAADSSSKGRCGGKADHPPSGECTPAGCGTLGPSPLTQQASMQRPGTPSVAQPGPVAAAPGAHLTDDASSAQDPLQAAATALPASHPGSSQQGQQVLLSEPGTAASSAPVDVGDVRRLVATVESLQRQVSSTALASLPVELVEQARMLPESCSYT